MATSAIAFAVGIIGFVRAIAAAKILSRPLTRLVITGLVALAVSRFVPHGAVQLYAQAVAVIVALWPLAYQMWRRPYLTHARTSRSATG